jgi:hypothetical protein
MKFTDFIGNEILPGSYVAYPGAGNVKGEYGLILYRVDSLDPIKRKVKATRLHIHYSGGQNGVTFHESHERNAMFTTSSIKHYGCTENCRISVQRKTSTIENTNKLVVVDPSNRVKRIFEKCVNLDSSIFSEITGDELSWWIHGGQTENNPFK